MKKKVLTALIGLTITLSMVLSTVAGCTPATPTLTTRLIATQTSQTSTSTPVILPPSVMPVVILKGSDYDMGYQYGQQAGQWMEKRSEGMWAAVASKTPQDVQNCLNALEYYTKKFAPEAITIMKGMADGAKASGYKLTYNDVLMLNWSSSSVSGPTWKFPEDLKKVTQSFSENASTEVEGCSHFSAWGSMTTDGKLICGDSSDQIFSYQITLVMLPDNGNGYVSTLLAGDLARHPAFNNKGVFLGSSGGIGQRDVDLGYGLSRPIAVYQMIRFANTAKEAKDMFLPWVYGGTNNFSLSDVSGDAYVVEVTAAAKGVRKTGDFGEKDFIFATNNYFTDELKDSLYGERRIDHAGWVSLATKTHHWNITSIGRNLEFWNLFTNYRGKVDLEFAKMIYRFGGSPPPYSLDASAYQDYLATEGKGGDPRIANPLSAIVTISQPDKGDKGAIHVCTGPASRGSYALFPGAAGIDYQIDNTYTFYRLTLVSDPSKIAGNAQSDAKASITKANDQLVKLALADPLYWDLSQRLSLAKTEYYEGLDWQNRAKLAKGNEALLNFSKAATAFAMCQAHSQQVYEAQVPPAMSPTDLGLGAYLGSWGQWSKR